MVSNYVRGNELIKHLNIQPCELFDRVKKGLPPLDEFGKPIPPPNVSIKLEELKSLNQEHERFIDRFKDICANFDELKKVKSQNQSMIMGLIELRERLAPRHEYVLEQIETLKQEIDRIPDKYSWANYNLPEDEASAKGVFDLLLRALFMSENNSHDHVLLNKEFMSGAELRERWNIDRQQFFKIIRFASAEISGNIKWLLRPHSPRNFKEVVFADGQHWPPKRNDHGFIKENYLPPEHENDLERVVEYLDQYQYLIQDVKTIEENFPELLRPIAAEKEDIKTGIQVIKKENRLSQIHKRKVRDIAKNIWQDDTTVTIEDVINSNDVNTATAPKVYHAKTLRGWIKDLAPNRERGRRPQRKQPSI